MNIIYNNLYKKNVTEKKMVKKRAKTSKTSNNFKIKYKNINK